MKQILPGPFEQSVHALMQKVGYTFHCTEDGRPCYHKQLNDPVFPRFHLYATKKGTGIEIDLHFDQLDTLHHKGNHEKDWAYTGERVNKEMTRIINEIGGHSNVKRISGSQKTEQSEQKPKERKTFLDILFK